MDEATRKSCTTVLNRLRKRQSLHAFRDPKRELIGLLGYVARVEHPTDYREVEDGLKAGRITTPAAFARLLRRMAANCLRFCVDLPNLSHRGAARKLLEAADEELGKELPGAVPPVLGDCWKCLKVLEQLLGQLVKEGKTPGLFWAKLEQGLMSSPDLASEYAAEVAYPMDCGRLTTELVEDGISAREFLAKAEVIFRNCRQFWAPRGDEGLVALADDLLAVLEKEAKVILPEAWAGRALPPLPPLGPVPPGKAALLAQIGAAAASSAPAPVPAPAPVAAAAPLPKLAATGPVKGSFGAGAGGGGAPPKLMVRMPGALARSESAASAGAALAAEGPPKGKGGLTRSFTLASSTPSTSGGGGGGAGAGMGTFKLKVKAGAGGGGGGGGGTGAPQLKKSFSLDTTAAASSSAAAAPASSAGAGAGPAPTLNIKLVAPTPSASGDTPAPPPSMVLRPSPSAMALAADPLLDDNASRASLPSRAATPVPALPSPTAVAAAAGAGPALSQKALDPSAAAALPRLVLRADSLPPGVPPSLQDAGAAAGATMLVLKPLQPGGGEQPQQQPQQQPPPQIKEEKGAAAAAAAAAKPVAKLPIRFKLVQSSHPSEAAAAAAAPTSPPTPQPKKEDAMEEDGPVFGSARKGRKRERSSLSPKPPRAGGPGRGKKKAKGGRGGGGAEAANGESVSPVGRKSGGGGGKVELDGWEKECWLYMDELAGVVKAMGAVSGKKGAKAAANRYDFEKPVLVAHPLLAEEYLRKVARPMDISTCRLHLREHQYSGPKAFLEDVDLIFANAIAFNEGSPDAYQQELELVSRHVRKYLDLLALEMLPLEEPYVDARLNLSPERREEQRAAVAERAGKQLAMPMEYKFCYAEMRDLVKACKKDDRRVEAYFTDPVSRDDNPQYYAQVARPMAFKDVMRSMETGSVRVAQVGWVLGRLLPCRAVPCLSVGVSFVARALCRYHAPTPDVGARPVPLPAD